MDIITLLGISIALSMDAFSASICKGLATRKFSLRTALLCAVWFGSFQALMPLIGYFLGNQFEHFITNFSLVFFPKSELTTDIIKIFNKSTTLNNWWSKKVILHDSYVDLSKGTSKIQYIKQGRSSHREQEKQKQCHIA